jgi:hypothetical protein
MATKAPSHRAPRAPRCAALPAEVWINIFRYHTDLAHLWLTCRRVSPTLRACAEYASGEYFLDHVHIDFQLEKYNLGGKSKRPEVGTAFARRGKGVEKEMAWFKDDRPDIPISQANGAGKKALEQYYRITRRWEENVKGCKVEMPNYTIEIGGVVNDTQIPGLSIDINTREIKFKWREMLKLFFREYERFLVLKEKFADETARKIRANNARLNKGEKLMPSDYPLQWATAEAEIRKEIRRKRLKEHYSGDERMLWAIDSLKHFEAYGAATGNAKALNVNSDLPGAGLGERWFGSVYLVQELYLDEWSCMHRIDTKVEHARSGT